MLTMKLKHGSKFTKVEMPPEEQLTVKILQTWIGRPCVLEFDDGRKKIYAIGNESVRGKWEIGKIILDMESFCHFWRYHVLNYGLDLFTQMENREERTAICEAEGVPQETIQQIFKDYPLIYGKDTTV